MTPAPRAVFLSYASQDAEAARKICDALRAAGVEVWFDQNELVGGDAWDAKIRKQIADCALFVPIISASTEARLEGYFRREWKQAALRTHDMADEKTFLLPVVIDATRDAEAKVPAEFKSVQWTRLPDGETPGKFCTRVKALLGGEGYRAETGGTIPSPSAPKPPSNPRSRLLGLPAILGLGGAVVLVGVAVFFALRPRRGPESTARVPAGAQTDAAPAPSRTKPASTTEARKLANQAMQLLEDPNFTRETSWLADELCQRALALDAADAEVWAVASFASQNLFLNTYDASASRREKARSQAERASQLDPSSVRAALAVARSLEGTGNNPEVLRMLRELHGRAPEDQQVIFSLLRAEGRQQNETAVQELLGKLRALPRTGVLPLTLWFEELRLRTAGRFAEAEPMLDEMLAGPEVLRGAYYEKLNLLMRSWHDLSEAGLFISKIPARFHQEPSFGSAFAYYWLWRAEPEKALQSLALVSQDYFEEYAAREPKGYLTGWAHAAAGRPAAAQAEWRNALAVVDERLKSDGRNFTLLNQRALLLALTGQREAAREAWQLRVELGGTQNLPGYEAESQVFLALNEPEAAIAALERDWASLSPGNRCSRLPNLRHHPAFAPIRSDPRVQRILSEGTALVQELKAQQTGAIKPALSAPALDKSVAVLAFADLSEKHDSEYFSDGISEELLNVLAKVPGLKVSARTSAFHFKGTNTPIPEIAKQLGVAYVVEGSVRKAGDKVRITAQLIKAADGFHVWSDTFTRDLKDVFAVQDEIAGLIARNLQLRLGAPSGDKINLAATVSADELESYRLYWEAREAWNRRNAEGYDRAEKLLERAIQLAPRFAKAHAALADVWELRGEWDNVVGPFVNRNSDLVLRIRRKVDEALALDPLCAEAHASRGLIAWNSWQFDAAEQSLREAIRLNPNYASAHQWLARAYMIQGRLDEALSSFARAAELDPLSPRILDNYAWGLLHAGRRQEALALLDRALALQPDAVQAISLKARILAQDGRKEEAAALELSVPRGLWISSHFRALALGFIGDTEARKRLEELLRDRNNITNFTAQLALGRTEEALDRLDPGRLESTRVDILLFDPFYDQVRRDPRFVRALEAIGLSAAHARAQAWRVAHSSALP